MSKTFAKAFYNSKAWKLCRDAYIAERIMIDGGLCEECQKNLGYIVHHKVQLTSDNINDPDITLNHELFRYVCKDCHDLYEGHGVGRDKAKALCFFDESGQPISLRECDKIQNCESPPG